MVSSGHYRVYIIKFSVIPAGMISFLFMNYCINFHVFFVEIDQNMKQNIFLYMFTIIYEI